MPKKATIPLIDSIRVRLTLLHLVILAVLQIGLGGMLYGLLYARMIHDADDILKTVTEATRSNLQAELSQTDDPYRGSALALDKLIHAETPVVIYNLEGRTLAERPSGAARITPLPRHAIAAGTTDYATLSRRPLQRIGVRRVGTIRVVAGPSQSVYFIGASQSLDAGLDEFHAARITFFIAIPILLLTTALGGWVLTGRSLAPATAMSERARLINADDMSERIQAKNPRDELGVLASSFNELLDRIAASSLRERHFMADAAHELRTPIAVIQTSVDIALSNARPSQDYIETLELISTYAQRLSRTIENVFRLARADAGFKVLEIHSLYLDEIIVESVAAARALAQNKNIRVEVGLLTEAAYRGDAALIGEMLLNLLENAVKYTPEGGQISVGFERFDDAYRITVSDTGVGIHESDRPKIFNRFFRARPAANISKVDRVPGSGMGLSIAQWIAQAHHGSLKLIDTAEGGSTFEILLPTMHADEKP